MAVPTLSELLQVETVDEMKQTMLGIASAVGLKVTSWGQGSALRSLLSVDAQMFANESVLQSLIAGSGFLSYSSGLWLTLLADQVYDVQRIDAARAVGMVTLSNSTLAAIPVTAFGLHLLNSTTGATYVITDSGSIPAGGDLDVGIQADDAGTVGDAAAGEIDALVNTILGVTVTNDDAIVGTDEESDVALRLRCVESLGAASPDGPKEIYSYVAKTLDTVSAPITRVRVFTSLTTGDIEVIIANAAGAPSGGDVTLVDAALQEQAVPQCITATAGAATALSQAITATVYVSDSTLTDLEIKALISTALNDYAKQTPIGGYDITGGGGSGTIDKAALEGVIINCLPEIKVVSMGTPAADVTVTIHQVLTIGVQTITVTRF